MQEAQVRLYSQNDPRWKNVTMETKKQTLGDFGCMVTSITNYLNMFHNARWNPMHVNNIIKNKSWYYNGSYLKTDELLRYYNIERVKKYEQICYVKRPEHCIIVLDRKSYKHYTNVIAKLSGRKLLVFDVWDGRSYILETTGKINYQELR